MSADRRPARNPLKKGNSRSELAPLNFFGHAPPRLRTSDTKQANQSSMIRTADPVTLCPEAGLSGTPFALSKLRPVLRGLSSGRSGSKQTSGAWRAGVQALALAQEVDK